MVHPWRVTASTLTYADRWLRVRSDRCETRGGRVIEPFHVLEFPAWVNVVALTPERELVLVREYRHGVGRVLTGLPSGGVEPGDHGPEGAARRELREETGFTGGRCFDLGSNYANPSNQNNAVWFVLADGVRETERPDPDPNEEIDVVTEDFVGFLGRFWRHDVPLQASHTAALHLASRFILGGHLPDSAALRERLLGALLA